MSDHEAWRDEPVRSIAGDQFGRVHIARRVADLITSTHSWDSSVVFALTGPWGSGKTSLLEMICELIKDKNEDWAIAWFTPWSSSDIDSLLQEFYASLTFALPTDRERTAREALGKCAKIVSPALKLIPYAGETIAQAAQRFGDKLTESMPWNDAFDKASSALREAKKPVLVIVDDLDRLQQNELLAVLKVVRLLGRFPGVDYLLAYDEQTLFNTLMGESTEVESRKRARRFMEKIVQYPIAVPPMMPSEISSRIDRGLTRITSAANRPLASAGPRLSRMLDVFERQLTTPRAVDRFLAQVELALSYHDPEEINDIDVIILAFVRAQFPDLYAELPRWRNHLTGAQATWPRADRNVDESDWRTLLTLAGSDDDVHDAKVVLEILFPAVSDSMRYEAHRGVSDPDYFSRYFVNTVPDDDVADNRISAALSDAYAKGSQQTLLSELFSDERPSKVELALRKLREASRPSARPSRDPEPVTLNLLSAIMSALPLLDDDIRLLFPPQRRGIRWAAEIIERLEPNTNANCQMDSLSCCGNLSLQLQVISCVRRDDVFSQEAFERAVDKLSEKAVAEVIENLIQRDNASMVPSITFLLHFIYNYGSVARAREEIQSGLVTSYTLEDFAARCVSISYLIAEEPIGKIEGFSQDIFAAIAPTDDPFYSEAIVDDIDPTIITWTNLRTYARGRAKAPTCPSDAALGSGEP